MTESQENFVSDAQPSDSATGAQPSVPVEVSQEHPEPEQTTEEPVTDTPNRVFLEALTEEELKLLLAARMQKNGNEAFAAALEDPESYDRILTELTQQHSSETDRVLTTLKDIIGNPHFGSKYTRDGKVILGVPRPQKITPPGGVVAGAEALSAFSLLTNRTRRIPLYNSGFSIDVTQPDLTVLNTFMSKHRTRINEYGRMFGSYFFYFHSLMIKETIVEMIKPLVLHSTLKNWNREDTLMRNIKIVDLKLILNTLGALMFPEGYKFTHVCTNSAEGGCTYHEQHLIDLNKLPHHDFTKLSDSCIQHMSRQAEATPDTLAAYQKSLGFDGRTIRHGLHGFDMRNPSIMDHIEYGRIYNGTLLSNLFADSPTAIHTAVLYSFYRIYTPLITRYTLYDEDGNVEMMVEDRDVIAYILSQIQQDDPTNELSRKFDAYIASTEISHICYAAGPCPSCGYVPESGYYAVDPELSFFMLSLTKLTPS